MIQRYFLLLLIFSIASCQYLNTERLNLAQFLSDENKAVKHSASKKGKKKLAVSQVLHGEGSWYEIKCNRGTHTASGETLNDWAMTAAHKTLPMGTKVRVTNLNNGTAAIVRINDRGPYIKGRIIDVTKGVAHKLDFVTRGIVPVKVEVLKPEEEKT